MQIRVLSIHREHELCWNAQQKTCISYTAYRRYFYILDDNKLYSSENLRMGRRNIWDTGQRKQKLEPVSSTSRRGAREAYHDEDPGDFGPRIAFTLSLVSDTSRPPIWQGGREMSALRPYETYPFQQPALFTPYTVINIPLYTKLFQLILLCAICFLYFCNLRMRSSRTIILYEIRIGTKYTETLPLKLDPDPLQYGVVIVNA